MFRDKLKDKIFKNKFYVGVGAILLIWGSTFFLIWAQANAISKDPCSICAEYQGKNFICSVSTLGLQKIYYPNGSAEIINTINFSSSEQYQETLQEIRKGIEKLKNLTFVNETKM